eukprot:4503605-Ditylum_brightwellii.AAC.1
MSLPLVFSLLVKFATYTVNCVFALAKLTTVVQSASVACARFASVSAAALLLNTIRCMVWTMLFVVYPAACCVAWCSSNTSWCAQLKWIFKLTHVWATTA